MRNFHISSESFPHCPNERKYLLLGKEGVEAESNLKREVNPRILGKRAEADGFWGTLGMANDSPIEWKGTLKFSERGNMRSTGVTSREVELIRMANPHLSSKHLKVTERFISFEDVEFDFPALFTPEDIPRFRLTLMLRSYEGALVYYQHHQGMGYEAADDAVEYILPQPTDSNHSTARDRLTYIFTAVPPRKIEENHNAPKKSLKLSNSPNPIKLRIKILVYRRMGYRTSQVLVKNQIKNITQATSDLKPFKQSLHIYNPTNNSFPPISGDLVDSSKKTLLLIHGTFSSPEGSFAALCDEQDNWLRKLLDETGYGQVLAFQYPSVDKDAFENIFALCALLKGKKFTDTVDVIGSSQGGLLAQQLANYYRKNKHFTVGRIALIASANGVDYLNSAENVSKFLSILKEISKRAGRGALAMICAIAQHSADYARSRPGLAQMKPDDVRLAKIMNSQPVSNKTLYLPVIDDFTRELVSAEPLFRRLGAMGLDLVTRAVMGPHNDWVVGTQRQYSIHPEFCYYKDYNPKNFHQHIIPAIHGRCLDTKRAKEMLWNFLTETSIEGMKGRRIEGMKGRRDEGMKG